ncbi:serine/threonine-protein kinase [Halotia branconii]|uniref:Tetratricopeptide repeat protein n=1 Tax=Halotia branconii CENA392 TaxID=1539056 RepID=A0AAJ6NUW1_9CYAN|nr:serine/threonine-protein kinase [Halotia branconii]WGV27163.1 tetratricopeptide repeat protein [Halotia branconii CENA392]
MDGQILDARYRIIKVLSVEEVVQTYLVEDTSLPDQQFVVKQLHLAKNHPQDLTVLRRLFAEEATAIAKLGKEHDQIQKLIASFEENEEFYLVQEFIFGSPLTEEVLLGTPLEEDQVISLLFEVLEILLFVHSCGVIHLDIKPANIIRRESDNKLVLVDFGAVQEIVTTIVGNLEYIPVEQLHGNPQYNSDIYALGIVAIAALIGLPANEISKLQSQKNVLTGEIVWRNRSMKVNQNLAKIIDKMVRFDYRKRYQSVTEVLHDLQQLTNQEPEGKKYNSKKLWLITAGIASCITFSIASWFFQSPKFVDNTQQLFQEGITKYNQGNYKQAVDNLTQVIKLEPKNALAYNRRGDAFYRLGDYQKSQADSSQAILLNPQDANAYYDRGFSAYELGKYQEAIADCTQAIKLDSKNAYAYYGRGLANTQLEQHKKAIADFSKAIALKPKYTDAYLQRGILHRRLKQKQAAIKDFNAIIEMNPNDARAYYQKGLTESLNQQKSAAISDYTNAINLNSQYIEAYLHRGDIYSELGNKVEATVDYNTVLQINPKLTVAYIHRGTHLLSFGDYQGAIKDYTQAIKLEPNNAAVYNNRGNAYLDMGNKKAANQDYTKAIAINSDYGLAYYNRGITRAKLGNKKEAVADFKKAAQLFKKKGDKNSYKDAQRELNLLRNR